MMHGLRRGLSSIFAIVVVCFATGAMAAEAYTTATIWLRTGPDTNFPRIERVPRNSYIDVYGCTDGYSWCDVDYDGERGWLPASRLQFVYNGRRGSVNNLAPFLGLMILEFSFRDYWSNHYQNRSWYNDRNLQRWQNWQPPQPLYRTQQAPPPQPQQMQSPPAAPSTTQPLTPRRQQKPSQPPVNQAPAPQAPAPVAPAPKVEPPAAPLQQTPQQQMQQRLQQHTPQSPQTEQPPAQGGKGAPKKKCAPPEICPP